MRPFKYSRAEDVHSAIQKVAANPNAKFLAGGTNILDLMKEDVERPDELIDVTRLDLAGVKMSSIGVSKKSIAIGGLGKNSDTANHPLIRQNFPLLSQAILSGASAQIRNMATNGGNLNQRTRCSYFYDVSMPCNKREPGSGCSALEGINRMHAVFGWSKDCVAVHPSDMCVALVALDATVRVQGIEGKERSIPIIDYHRLPDNMPQIDNNLKQGELITAIDIPENNFAGNSYYLKIRDRASYAFALVSVAAGLEINGDSIQQARIAMGGVAHKPWRAAEAEKFLVGKTPTQENYKAAAEVEMRNADPLEHNKFKIELGKRAIVRALQLAISNNMS
ncbi:FAD-binding molybdopterin dehydrogenase [Niastella yeongjuensis]|uniref:FAD-binding molybdopterin dehydrogenase n=1 Tax=Niastella yeongjuensis TaxID=354355 RepID=A0A1V9EDH1_9BACT|nr:xanthine dehydrogenase family protein subunit M [Niastella yeongjuensis]OQP44170.1 FAD-binding molybdopterin dehydrogenase [Niastella yeongjuensis]SEP21975.1 xanthine dehydrogenase YagS FAD-binding subunit [Niastella yeongjuensis]